MESVGKVSPPVKINARIAGTMPGNFTFCTEQVLPLKGSHVGFISHTFLNTYIYDFCTLFLQSHRQRGGLMNGGDEVSQQWLDFSRAMLQCFMHQSWYHAPCCIFFFLGNRRDVHFEYLEKNKIKNHGSLE